MKLLERILVGVDFRATTADVIGAAHSTAAAFKAEIVLAHVLPRSSDWNEPDRAALAMAREGAQARLATLRAHLLEQGLAVAEPVVAEGVVFDQIIRLAESYDVNAIIVGASGDATGGGSSLGTSADRLLRRSNKPVWVVAPGGRDRPREILCPIDGSSPSRRALNNAIHLARRFGAQLSVLHVLSADWEQPAIGPEGGGVAAAPAVGEGMAEDAATKRAANELERAQRFLDEFDFHGVQWELIVGRGDPASEIIRVAERRRTDLLVMGSVGRTGLARILMGSVAGKVVRDLPCSTIMVKAEDAVRLKIDQELADITTHYGRGTEFLENGFPAEARREFVQCTRINEMFTPAWEGLAIANERLGLVEQAEEARQTGRHIEQTLGWRKVEADIRSRHALWSH